MIPYVPLLRARYDAPAPIIIGTNDVQIFVEIERARLTRILAKIREDEGKISDAAKILQELQVGNIVYCANSCVVSLRQCRWRHLVLWRKTRK